LFYEDQNRENQIKNLTTLPAHRLLLTIFTSTSGQIFSANGIKYSFVSPATTKTSVPPFANFFNFTEFFAFDCFDSTILQLPIVKLVRFKLDRFVFRDANLAIS
jgi:hypothetical protein